MVPVSVSKEPLASRSHSYLAIVPSGSPEPAASKSTLAPLWAGLGESVKEALGAWFSTVSTRVVVAVAPSLSVTRSPTVRSPPLA